MYISVLNSPACPASFSSAEHLSARCLRSVVTTALQTEGAAVHAVICQQLAAALCTLCPPSEDFLQAFVVVVELLTSTCTQMSWQEYCPCFECAAL